MRLLTICAFYPPHHSGGYEMRCKMVMDQLIEMGHEIIVITNKCLDPNCVMHQNETGILRSIHVKQKPGNIFGQILYDAADLLFIEKTVEVFQPEIIYLWHIQNLSNTILPYFSNRNLPIVFDEGGSGIVYLSRVLNRGLYFYENDSDSFIKKTVKKTINYMAGIISLKRIKDKWSWPKQMRVYFNSYSSKEYALSKGAPVNDASVIHSGIDVSQFPFQERNYINDPVKIIMPTRIKPEKGIQDSIALVKELKQNGFSVHLIVLGIIQDAEYFTDQLQQVQEFGLSESIDFRSMVSQKELSQLYRDSDFCFFASYFKTGLSRVPMEAMASGCIIISYCGEGSGEIIQNSENGFLVQEGDIHAVVKHIRTLIENPSTYHMMIRAARKTIESNFSMEYYVDSIESFLKESMKTPTLMGVTIPGEQTRHN